mmetsp:Transcript_6182/g.10597  ORF Transcript_6182/g.10597 Transcript_6182/m.10597 type:complete len:150 (+) Transcript_6182:5387-5836(+)
MRTMSPVPYHQNKQDTNKLIHLVRFPQIFLVVPCISVPGSQGRGSTLTTKQVFGQPVKHPASKAVAIPPQRCQPHKPPNQLVPLPRNSSLAARPLLIPTQIKDRSNAKIRPRINIVPLDLNLLSCVPNSNVASKTRQPTQLALSPRISS